MNKILASILSLIILLSLGATLVYAQGGGNPPTGGGNPPTGGGNPPTGGGNPLPPSTADITLDNPFAQEGSLVDLLNLIIEKIIFPIGGVLAILAFIYAGFKYVTAQGDTSKITEAHQTLLYVAIGTAILLGARVISEVISGTINQLK